MSLLFAREGAHVAVADMNRESAEDTVQRIAAEGGQAFSIEADIAREADVNRMIDEAVDGLGGLDGMVLNVGIGVGALGLDGVDLKEWNDTFAVNLTGPMLCCRKALKHLADGSSIVFISSIAAIRSGSRLIAYDTSKAALGGLMRNVAKEGARRGIRANIIYPGLVDTPLGRLGAGDALELRTAHGGQAQVVVEKGRVHGGLVLAEHHHLFAVFPEKERGAESPGTIADDEHVDRFGHDASV